MKRIYLFAFIAFFFESQLTAQITLTRSQKYDAEVHHVSTHIYRVASTLSDGAGCSDFSGFFKQIQYLNHYYWFLRIFMLRNSNI